MACDQGALFRLQNSNNKIRMLFREPELQDQIDLLSNYMRNVRNPVYMEIEKRIKEKFQWVLDLLIGYSGHFDSMAHTS